MAYTIFNKEAVYNEEVAPLVEKIRSLCTIKGIPFFFGACVKNEDNASEYRYNGNFCGSSGFILYDDRITKCLNVVNGFDTVPRREKIDLSMDEELWNAVNEGLPADSD